MNYLVAVSGGVDSVVLLDMLARTDAHLIVAHVDHGIRQESSDDARFVTALARQYGLPFVSVELKLGARASEERARRARYDFLFAQAAKHRAQIVTAHHANDLVETVALNLERGTGWRGLAVLDRQGIYRPLLNLSKQQVYDYAVRHHLEWVEDATNRQQMYQRNRLRARLATRPVDAGVIAKLWARQLQLRKDIDREANRLIARQSGSRHFMSQLDQQTALELLATDIQQQIGQRPMRPQLTRALLAIKTAKPGAEYHVGEKIILTFTSRQYKVKVL